VQGSPRRAASPGHPFVATHRGDSGLPENTIAAFRTALDSGAEYLEADLVASRDGVLVLRHDRWLSPTTDVAERPELVGRRAVKQVEDDALTDWWVEDFDATELADLCATVRGAASSDDHRIATLDDLLELAGDASTGGRFVGLYLEVKEPLAFRKLGHDLEALLAGALRAGGLDRADGRVYVQSWEPDAVLRLSAALEAPAVQIVPAASGWDGHVTPPGLRGLREQGVVGVNAAAARLRADPGLIGRAHAAGLVVHGWGFGPEEDYGRWIDAGLDGIVTDDVAAVLAARKRAGRRPD
jgi:glycerophosphoryl diester phosphodiesterase